MSSASRACPDSAFGDGDLIHLSRFPKFLLRVFLGLGQVQVVVGFQLEQCVSSSRGKRTSWRRSEFRINFAYSCPRGCGGAAKTMADVMQPFDVGLHDANVAGPLPLQISNATQQAYISELLSFNLERLHKVCHRGNVQHSIVYPINPAV